MKSSPIRKKYDLNKHYMIYTSVSILSSVDFRQNIKLLMIVTLPFSYSPRTMTVYQGLTSAPIGHASASGSLVLSTIPSSVFTLQGPQPESESLFYFFSFFLFLILCFCFIYLSFLLFSFLQFSFFVFSFHSFSLYLFSFFPYWILSLFLVHICLFFNCHLFL